VVFVLGSKVQISLYMDEPNNYPPPGRQEAAVGYDRARNRTVIFGGTDINGNALNDTWVYNLTDQYWYAITPTISPPATSSMVYGVWEAMGLFVISMGQVANGTYTNAIWAYTFATDDWSQINPGGPLPTARAGASGGIYPTTSILWVTHGITSGGVIQDTWSIDLSTNAWSIRTPSSNLPPARSYQAGGTVSSTSIFIFGGCSSGTTCFSDTWLYAAGAWTQIAVKSKGGNPSARGRVAGALFGLLASNSSVLQGGSVGSNEVWFLETNTQTYFKLNAQNADLPAPREGASMFWRPMLTGENVTSYTIFFGGASTDGSIFYNDHWRFIGNFAFNFGTQLAPMFLFTIIGLFLALML